MKWVLLLSVILNGFLGWKLTQKREVVREEIVEKVIVKKAAPEVIEKKVIVEVPKETRDETSRVHFGDVDEVAVDDSVQDVTKMREDFLVGKLGFTDKEFKAIEEVKKSYMERYQKIVNPDEPFMNLQQRKALLLLEEQRDAEFARAVGPERWKQFENFRDNYNRKEFKKAMKQSGVIVPMEI